MLYGLLGDSSTTIVRGDQEEQNMAGSGQVSEHKHQSKAKGQHPMTQTATRSLFENQAVKGWEMDVATGDTFGLHQHTNDAVLYITSAATLQGDEQDVET